MPQNEQISMSLSHWTCISEELTQTVSKLKIPNSGKLPLGKQKYTNKVINMHKIFMDINVFCNYRFGQY